MATLVENANRIYDAAADIYQAIVEKGVTPSGKIETFAEAISQISGESFSYWQYFIQTFNDVNDERFYYCGFKPSWIFAITNAGSSDKFGMTVYNVEEEQQRGSRYGTTQASAGITVNFTEVNEVGFKAKPFGANYLNNVEFLAVADTSSPIPVPPEPTTQTAVGNFELTKGTALKHIELGFKPKVLILNQRAAANYQNASARTFIYNEELSATNYDSIVTTTASKQNLGTTTVLQIYSIDVDGFTQRPHGTNTTYWSYYAIGGTE